MDRDAELDAERTKLVQQLAARIGRPRSVVERAIDIQNTSYLPDKRNIIAVLSSVAQLIALTDQLPDAGWWHTGSSGGQTPAQRLEAGEIDTVAQDLINKCAGPYDLHWDQQWPPETARKRMLERLPGTARPGDILIGADGGARVKLQVIEGQDGRLTAEPLSETWVDPPGEDVAAKTYARLAERFPWALPTLG